MKLSLRALAHAVGLALSLAAGGCAVDAADTDSTTEDAKASSKNATTLRAALDELNAQMDRYSAYYDDSADGNRQNGVRIAGCWANPAGHKLSDMQKAFYCSMPLEFRLCNTVTLLSSKDPAVRYQGYLDCKATVANALGDDSFDYSSNVDLAYKHLYIEQRSDWAVSTIVDEKRPNQSHGFPFLLAKIIETLDQEAADLAGNELRSLIDGADDQTY